MPAPAQASVVTSAPTAPASGPADPGRSGGTPLKALLAAGPLPIDRVLALGAQLAAALAVIHRAGVVHGDFNPAHTLVDERWKAAVTGAGIAHPQDATAAAGEGRIAGALAYLSPEQTGRTGRPVDQRSDLYALGATLYEMCTGRTPFGTEDPLQVVHDHLVREPTPPCEVDARVPRMLSDLILRLLAKEPAMRFQSADGVAHDLRRMRDTGSAAAFALGERDFPARIPAPASLVGRAAESAMLEQAFGKAFTTAQHTVLVAGAAGVGKTALLQCLRPLAAQAGGWVVSGKCDPYQREKAHEAAPTQALRALGRLLLALPPGEIAQQRESILRSLGRGAGLINRMAPEFTRLLGEQPEPLELDPQQAEQQMHQLLVDLLGAVASPRRPLVIVLDDLQWAGPLTLRGFERMMNEPQLRGVLLVGVYRPDDEAAQGILAQRDRWRGQPLPPLEIALGNLDREGVGELVGRMLRLDAPAAADLVDAVWEATGGNAFDAVEVVNALRRDGVLHLSEAGWSWDLHAMRRYVGRGMAEGLLAQRIEALPAGCADLLQFMACLGNDVELELACAAAGMPPAQVREHLCAAIDEGVVHMDRKSGRDHVVFRHDRVQQAVLACMTASQRAHRQLAMARRLAVNPALEAQAAQQYLACTDALIGERDAGEIRRVAALFQKMSQDLTSVGITTLAERYLSQAAALLAALGDPADAPRRAAIDVMRHAALYALGQLDASDQLFEAMRAHDLAPAAQVGAACLQIRSLVSRGRIAEAMDLGWGLLARLGVEVPRDFAVDDVDRRLQALVQWARRDRDADHRSRPQLKDARLLAVAKLLSWMLRAAFFLPDTRALAWLVLEGQRMWEAHGPCADLVVCISRAGQLLIRAREDFRGAYDVVGHVVAVGEALHYEPQTSEARVAFSSVCVHWFEPLEAAVREIRRAHDGVLAGGDPSYAAHALVPLYPPLIATSAAIEACEKDLDAGMALCQRTGHLLAAAMHAHAKQALRELRGKRLVSAAGGAGRFDEAALLTQTVHLPNVQYVWTHSRMHLALLMGDVATLSDMQVSQSGYVAGYYLSVHDHFMTAMARAWQLRADAPQEGRDRLQAELAASRGWLAARAQDQRENFLHLVLLVDAESAWTRGDRWAAAALFDEAMGECARVARAWHHALVTERAGLFHLQNGLAQTGRQLLALARDRYAAWGASVKVAQMERAHAFLAGPAQPVRLAPAVQQPLPPGGGTPRGDAWDLMGVLRASQVLSSATNLASLTSRITEVLEALSGATRVCVLTWREGRWWLLGTDGTPAPLEQVTAAGLLPASALGYAERMGEVLIVEDAAVDDRFARDPYFSQASLCSLLVAPIASQGVTRAMLYLENRQVRGAFNANRLDAVRLIAGQLAVSLANAQLYESLEELVEARTRELREMQARLVETARRAGKAEIANNVLHNVGNVLNSINVSAGTLRSTIQKSRVDGLSRAVALLNEMDRDLAGFMGNDPRGPALLAYLNELVTALGAERADALHDLDRLAQSVEHITYVVASQQSHAGPSSIVEMARPAEVVEEALQLCADMMAGSGVQVARVAAELPAMPLDRQRIVQILVNLLRNACQATQSVAADSRRVTLGIATVRGESGEQLRISVEDNGEGIPQDRLDRIFSHGFTTRSGGHGFGLHSSALAATEMGGRLSATSEGAGRGATFVLELPVRDARPARQNLSDGPR